jgi:hypothetical protein
MKHSFIRTVPSVAFLFALDPTSLVTVIAFPRTSVRGNVISSNMAFNQGGGIWIVNFSPASIVQNLIIDNFAPEGGGIFWITSPAFLIFNTISNNDSLFGSGLNVGFLGGEFVAKSGQTAIFGGGFFFGDASGFKFNDAFSPQGAAWGGGIPDQTGLSGDISADPLFVSPTTGNYHLRPGSPVIDAGDNSAADLPATDLDGNPRIQDGNGDGIAVVDMGVYERTAPFEICIQDDSNGSILRINSTTGDYQFTNCSGLILSGTSALTKRGNLITLQQSAGDRRVLARIDGGVNRATAYIQAQGMTFTIADRNIADNICACTAQ